MTPQLYGSRATSPSAGIGGVDGGLLRDGAQLPLGDVASTDAEIHLNGREVICSMVRLLTCGRFPGRRMIAKARCAGYFFSTPHRVTPCSTGGHASKARGWRMSIMLTYPQTVLSQARCRCPAMASQSFCWPIIRPPAVIQRLRQ